MEGGRVWGWMVNATAVEVSQCLVSCFNRQDISNSPDTLFHCGLYKPVSGRRGLGALWITHFVVLAWGSERGESLGMYLPALCEHSWGSEQCRVSPELSSTMKWLSPPSLIPTTLFSSPSSILSPVFTSSPAHTPPSTSLFPKSHSMPSVQTYIEYTWVELPKHRCICYESIHNT